MEERYRTEEEEKSRTSENFPEPSGGSVLERKIKNKGRKKSRRHNFRKEGRHLKTGNRNAAIEKHEKESAIFKTKNHSRICSKTVVVSGLSDIVIEFINVRSYYFRHFDIKSWFALLFLEFFFQIKSALRSTEKILEGRKTKST